MWEELMEEDGSLDDLVCRIEPVPAEEDDLLRCMMYIASVRAGEPNLAFGLGSDDIPVFPGIYRASCL